MPAKIRTVKPEFFLHDGLFDLEQESGFPIRVAYVGLWTQCDREGRFAWKPRMLKLQILPYDDVDFERVLDALVTRGFIVKYASEDQTFGCIPTFTRHQVINNRESDSKLPAPPETNASLTREPRVPDASTTPLESPSVEWNGTGMELEGNGTGRELPQPPKGAGARASRSRSAKYPADFESWYAAYPRKVGKDAAAKAWERVQTRLQAQRFQERPEVAKFLTDRATTYAASPAGKRGQYTPHPSTWLTDGRYADDDAEWQRTDFGSGRGIVQAGDGQVAAGDSVGW